MKTPKSAKKAGKEVAVDTPKKMKTPKKPKTPEVKAPVAETPKTPKTPKIKVEDAVQKPNGSQPDKSANGSEGGDSFFYKRGGGRGGPGGFRGGRGGFRGGRGGEGGRPGQVEDPAGVFMLFHEGVTADIAKALLEKYKGADFEFSRGITIHFKSEDEANKVKEKAPETEFAGVKPTKVGQAFRKREPEKRPNPEDEETAPKKKQKVEATVEEDDDEEEEESGEEEEGEDDDEEGEEEEDDEEDDDDDDDEEEDDDDDDE